MKGTAVSAAWGEWIAGMGDWHLFGGLTYRQSPTNAIRGPEAVTKDAQRWLRQADAALSHRVEAAVLAVEYHRSGWPHIHPLLRLSGGLRGGDVTTAGGLWYEKHGYARLEAPRDARAVASYAAKYLAKDLDRGDVILWPRKGSLGVSQPALRVHG